MNRRDGFSLIEALVALTVAAVALLAIFELQHQLSAGQRRYETALRAAEGQRDALTLLRDLNPVEQPTGSLPLGGGRGIAWTSTPLGPFRDVRPGPGGTGLHQVRLYRLHVRIVDPAAGGPRAFDLDRLGWRRI